jgi:hypothetical protein
MDAARSKWLDFSPLQAWTWWKQVVDVPLIIIQGGFLGPIAGILVATRSSSQISIISTVDVTTLLFGALITIVSAAISISLFIHIKSAMPSLIHEHRNIEEYLEKCQKITVNPTRWHLEMAKCVNLWQEQNEVSKLRFCILTIQLTTWAACLFFGLSAVVFSFREFFLLAL